MWELFFSDPQQKAPIAITSSVQPFLEKEVKKETKKMRRKSRSRSRSRRSRSRDRQRRSRSRSRGYGRPRRYVFGLYLSRVSRVRPSRDKLN